jgi:hypothetical protein
MTMTATLSSRLAAFAAACGVTLAVMAGIDRLAELPAAASAQLALVAAQPAA